MIVTFAIFVVAMAALSAHPPRYDRLLVTAQVTPFTLPTVTTTTAAPTTTIAATAAPATTTTVDWQALARAVDYHTWSDWPTWHALGICEQGGNSIEGDGIAWHGQPAGGSPDSAYPGGLGMSRDAWAAYRGPAGVTVSVGAYASPADQIRVGREEVREIGSFRGWAAGTLQCMRARFGIDVN